MKISTALFASVVAICCLSCSMNTNDTTKTDDTPINTDDDTKKVAEQGDVTAQFNLGNMYARRAYKGEGAPKDFTEAAKWYRKAAEQGHAEAQVNLGSMYRNGNEYYKGSVPKDFTEAMKWFRKAAEQGDAEGQHMLGNMYYGGGIGRPKEKWEWDAVRLEASEWYRKAAEQGHAEAQRVLGRMYAEGDGVPEDYVEAYMWFNIAAAHGNEYTAKSFIDKLLAKMSQEQIAEAQAMTRKWLEDFEKRNQGRPL